MRSLLIVLDSVGIGAAPDAASYGDAGADTLGHLLEAEPSLNLPMLWSMGLGRILGRGLREPVHSAYGTMRPAAAGKDSTTGHWELAGVVLDEPFAVFDAFPPELVARIESACGVRFLGNCAASGTEIIDRLGERHMSTGRPILYTSADSVLQIAAHESVISIESLYEICRVARAEADAYRIGRVIARPFIGAPGDFRRTGNRHDFSMRPPCTVLNALCDAGCPVKAIGKVADLFDGQGITESHPTGSNEEGMAAIEEVWRETDAGLVFANLVDFDAVYGHRRDPGGYARALMDFDRWLAGFLPQCRPEDLLIITADHGNDPTFRGTDHTREQVPVMVRWGDLRGNLGCRTTFADVAATLSEFFGIQPHWRAGLGLLSTSGDLKAVKSRPLAAQRD